MTEVKKFTFDDSLLGAPDSDRIDRGTQRTSDDTQRKLFDSTGVPWQTGHQGTAGFRALDAQWNWPGKPASGSTVGGDPVVKSQHKNQE